MLGVHSNCQACAPLNLRPWLHQEQLERQLPKPKKGAAPAAAAAAADEDDDDEGDDEEGGEDAAGEDGFGALRPQVRSDALCISSNSCSRLHE